MKPICCPGLFGNLCFCGAAQAISTKNMANWIPPQSQLEGRVIKTDVCACVCALVVGTTFIPKVKATCIKIYLSRRSKFSYFSFRPTSLSDAFLYLIHACTAHTGTEGLQMCLLFSGGSRATYPVPPWPLYVTEPLAFPSALLLWGDKYQAWIRSQKNNCQEVEQPSPNRFGFFRAT